jgi:hypothetical protein
MEIQWVKYLGASGTKYLLALPLGVSGRKLSLLDCSKVPAREITMIRGALPELTKLSLAQRIKWLKLACPDSYRLGFRTLPEDKVVQVNRYELNAMS